MAVCLATSVTEPKGSPAGEGDVFRQLQEQGADFLLTVKANQKTLHRQICSQFQGKRKIPFTATDYEKRHGRDTTWNLRAKEAPDHIKANWPGCSWIVEVISTVTRKGKRVEQAHHFLTSLRTAPKALLRLVRQRWSIENVSRHRILSQRRHQK